MPFKNNGNESLKVHQWQYCGMEFATRTFATSARFKSKDGAESADEQEEIVRTQWMITGWQKSQKMENQTAEWPSILVRKLDIDGRTGTLHKIEYIPIRRRRRRRRR